jgi:hypothetical protein
MPTTWAIAIAPRRESSTQSRFTANFMRCILA